MSDLDFWSESELNIWSVWYRDADAAAVREQLDPGEVEDARAKALKRDMRALRARAKQYKHIAKEAHKAGDLDGTTTARRLRELCRRILKDSQQDAYKIIDHEEMRDNKSRPRDALDSYTYDGCAHEMRREPTAVSAQVRDAAWPPVLDYPEIALLLPDLSQR